MAYVLTVDQIGSRRRQDLVGTVMTSLAARLPGVPVTRTVGDEFQLLVSGEPLSVVTAILVLMRDGDWHVGVGIGPVEEPTPADIAAAIGVILIILVLIIAAIQRALVGGEDS